MKIFKSKLGITLIEVIISLAIFSIIFMSFISMFSSSYVNIFNMGNKTTATRIAQKYVDQIYEGADPNLLPTEYEGYSITYDRKNFDSNNDMDQLNVTVSFANGKHSSTVTVLVEKDVEYFIE